MRSQLLDTKSYQKTQPLRKQRIYKQRSPNGLRCLLLLPQRKDDVDFGKNMASKKKGSTAADKGYQAIADKLLSLMEAGTLPWRKPWSTTPYMNALTGHRYRGVNPLLAEFDILFSRYSNPLFVGYEQARNVGWIVKKGSKATGLSLCKRITKEVEDLATGESKAQSYTYRKWLKVFNLDCIDDDESDLKVKDVIAKYRSEPNTSPRMEDAERLIAAQQAVINFGGNRACYSPSLDRIQMPPYESFSSPEAYYATIIHELIHRSGHASRLNRNLDGEKGSSDYAFEELVADVGSAFVCGMLGISPELENHASYLEHWMSRIRDDNKAFFKAFALAKAAADFLLENAGMLPEEDSVDA